MLGDATDLPTILELFDLIMESIYALGREDVAVVKAAYNLPWGYPADVEVAYPDGTRLGYSIIKLRSARDGSGAWGCMRRGFLRDAVRVDGRMMQPELRHLHPHQWRLHVAILPS